MFKNKKGFTLIETLIVVLLIAILAAIAFPNYEAAMERTRVASNISLFRPMANAAMQYYTFNDEWPDSLKKLPVGVPEAWTVSGLTATSPATASGTCTITLTPDSSMTMVCGRGGEDYKFEARYTIDENGKISIGETLFFVLAGSGTQTEKLLKKAARSLGWKASGTGYKI